MEPGGRQRAARNSFAQRVKEKSNDSEHKEIDPGPSARQGGKPYQRAIAGQIMVF